MVPSLSFRLFLMVVTANCHESQGVILFYERAQLCLSVSHTLLTLFSIEGRCWSGFGMCMIMPASLDLTVSVTPFLLAGWR
jgi:hypothetical protein